MKWKDYRIGSLVFRYSSIWNSDWDNNFANLDPSLMENLENKNPVTTFLKLFNS